MREIKFRAWDGEKFRESFVIHQANGLAMVETTTPLGSRYLETQAEWAVQQYTGLKDKNGVEIYEGYILGYFDAIVNNNKKGESFGSKERTEIKWAKAYSGEQWCEFNIRDYNGKDVKSDEPNDYYGGIHPEYKEVIGNIFEGVDK